MPSMNESTVEIGIHICAVHQYRWRNSGVAERSAKTGANNDHRSRAPLKCNYRVRRSMSTCVSPVNRRISRSGFWSLPGDASDARATAPRKLKSGVCSFCEKLQLKRMQSTSSRYALVSRYATSLLDTCTAETSYILSTHGQPVRLPCGLLHMIEIKRAGLYGLARKAQGSMAVTL